ncbi:hypothetical protein, no similarity [Geotrichum candidum]|uniref:Uncharacterized protein n=1 Tax=Geotrichum candidum TaxID=1173061 RepID=A0A0J9XD64_GEOCN|nr:hypothetical protein, no similarity [Geotrichum candidum]
MYRDKLMLSRVIHSKKDSSCPHSNITFWVPLHKCDTESLQQLWISVSIKFIVKSSKQGLSSSSKRLCRFIFFIVLKVRNFSA